MATRFDRNKLNIWVDIDETICITPATRKYVESVPIKENIEKVNKLFDLGHNITYWTARGSVTKVDHSELTKSQLDSWGCKYHRFETEYKKPNWDILIDDKTVNSMLDWDENNDKVKEVYNAHEDYDYKNKK